MRVLMLYGVNCTERIWDSLSPYLEDYEIDYVEYPHEITKDAADVDTLTEWVYKKYHKNSYNAVVGHSMGGIIALQLAANYHMEFKKIISLDTNLVPAKEFYRNLITQEHMETFGPDLLQMFAEENKYYHPDLFKKLQEEFDYTGYLFKISQKVYAIYGDRGETEYPNKIQDLNLSKDVLERLELRFLPDSCHMMMIENPEQLADVLRDIFKM